MTRIVAIIHGDDGAYGVSYPDFPGLASGGATIEEALRRSKEGLDLHIESMLEDGEDLPSIRSIDQIKADPEIAEDLSDTIAFVFVDYDLPGKPVRLNISLDDRLVDRIDRAAKTHGETRSGFLAQAAKERLSALA